MIYTLPLFLITTIYIRAYGKLFVIIYHMLTLARGLIKQGVNFIGKWHLSTGLRPRL